MALTGSFYEITFTASATETYSYTASYPADLPANHPDYSKRGTTVVETAPVSISSSVEHTGSFVQVGSAVAHSHYDVNGIKLTYVSGMYRVFENEDDKIYENTSASFEEHIDFIEYNHDSGSPVQVLYNHMKTLDAFKDMTDI